MRTARRRPPAPSRAASNSGIQLLRGFAEGQAVYVGGERDYALTVVAFDESRHGAEFDARHVGQLDFTAVLLRQRKTA